MPLRRGIVVSTMPIHCKIKKYYLPGHLLSAFVKEKFDEFLQALRLGIVGLLRKDYTGTCTKLQAPNFWSAQVDRFSMKSSGGIGKKVAHLLSTGNIVSTTGLDLMQVSGYTIVAERLELFTILCTLSFGPSWFFLYGNENYRGT